MKKIFISHNQDFTQARSVKGLINILGSYGVLVEDEPGAESPDKKSFRLLKESDGFLAICTKDLKDENGNFSPKANVALEIKEWQSLHQTEKMVIIKEKQSTLPVLLGNPAYAGEFDGVNILDAFYRAVREFQTMQLIPYKNMAPQKPKQATISISEKEVQVLNYLANTSKQRAYESDIVKQFNFSTGEWNAAVHKLVTSSSMMRITYDHYGKVLEITSFGFDYLLKHNLFRANK